VKQSSRWRAKIDNSPTQAASREVKGRNPREKRESSTGLNSRYFSNGALSPATAEVRILVVLRRRQSRRRGSTVRIFEVELTAFINSPLTAHTRGSFLLIEMGN